MKIERVVQQARSRLEAIRLWAMWVELSSLERRRRGFPSFAIGTTFLEKGNGSQIPTSVLQTFPEIATPITLKLLPNAS